MRIETTSLPLGAIGGTDPKDPLAADEAKRKARFEAMLAADQEAFDILGEITKDGAKGYWAWKIDQLRKEITEQVMGEMNMTQEKLAAMSLEDRLALEEKIEKIVEERLKLAIREEMEQKQRDLLAATASLRGVLGATQDIAAIDDALLML